MNITNGLPDEVLIKIFGFLSPHMLKNCNLVCKRWDDIISSSKELMSKFQLVIYGPDDYLDVQKLNRNQQSIIVRKLCAESLDAICHFNLSELDVCYSENQKLSDLVEAIRNLPMLKVFSAWEVKFEDDIPDIQSFERININIEKVHCVAEVIRIFDCSTLKNVRLLWNNEMPLERKLLTYELLSKQKNLEYFILSEYQMDNFFHSREIFMKFQFRLKSFQYFSAASPLKHYKNFIRFLDSQKSSLTTLDLEMQPRDMIKIETIQKYVLEHMINLKTLRLDLSVRDEENTQWISEIDEKLEPTQVTKNITSLKYKGPQTSLSKCKRLIDLFPNLKYLHFESDYVREFKVLKHVSKTQVNIESLEFLSFHSDIVTSFSVYFPKLKNLSTFAICDENAFSSFVSRHSTTLERITIEDIDDMTELTANAIMECENLKYVKLGTWNDDLLSVMNLFHEISSRDKPLTFIYEFFSSSTTFKFPEDKIFWDEKLGIESEEIFIPTSKSNNVEKFFKAIWNGISVMFS
ncbi:uncharacterized protein [Chironomus tepperi]|uniref:uncharacterized protein n=1 Tax=Chironomus tepperi TaxID=113505 RepID=UPI00391FA3F6